ncbi:class I SAM-dependent methyltransferase [Lipingzhangella sp. LS1_29]|uniref:Class I SAM-dependent methyltransferase n=1 Tax=Lipingzhangella rawalii TaxID=2055835 RepID=A0ABU2H451_9ACTN|nr:class I SAM-dependent methyltransferase [Lipingzhangella rawalii]MDS1269777.1 class I SAM-dependent methyltransferase [Lipingzhangella rawalii]
MTNTHSPSAVPDLVTQPTPYYDSAMFLERIHEIAEHRHAQYGPGELRILEAGCGRRWSLGEVHVPGMRPHVTGVDTNAESLRMRLEEHGDLDEAIVGDLRSVELPTESYDVVFCSWVLEHVSGAEQVLDRLVSTLRPGGYLLLRIPDRDSVYGFATRCTPFPLHVAYKRYVRRRPNAGRPGYGPFPTVYDRVVSHRGMLDYCARAGLEVTAQYSSNFHLLFFGRYARLVDLALRGVAVASLGRLTAEHNNLAFVLRKPD